MSRKPDDSAAPLEGLDAELFAPGLLHELRQPLMGADAAATLLERSLGAVARRRTRNGGSCAASSPGSPRS